MKTRNQQNFGNSTRSFWRKSKKKRGTEADDSFFQKLVDGFDVNVLVVGNSIAENG